MSSPFQQQFSAKSPLSQKKYKKGDLISEDDAAKLTDLNVHELSEIQQDERSQYMTTTDNDTIRSNKRKFFKTKDDSFENEKKLDIEIEKARASMPKPY
tara:strand:- start:205 stop:501 length:297 start_codon:yes stop_codon:yes gene_type:complete